MQIFFALGSEKRGPVSTTVKTPAKHHCYKKEWGEFEQRTQNNFYIRHGNSLSKHFISRIHNNVPPRKSTVVNKWEQGVTTEAPVDDHIPKPVLENNDKSKGVFYLLRRVWRNSLQCYSVKCTLRSDRGRKQWDYKHYISRI